MYIGLGFTFFTSYYSLSALFSTLAGGLGLVGFGVIGVTINPQIRGSRVFPNYNNGLGPRGSTPYNVLTFINDLKAEIESHAGRISDARMSTYLGQIEDYIRYAKKNAKRTSGFHFSHQVLQEFKRSLRSHFEDISLKDIRKYKKFNSLKIGKSKVYDYNEYFVENYFQRIDSLDKAYWLGFIYADGSLSFKPQIIAKDGTRYVRFRFTQIYRFGEGKGDLSGKVNCDGIRAVNRLAKALGIYPSKVGIDTSGAYGFEITSKTLTDQLNGYGVIIGGDKTYNIRLPNLNSRGLYLTFLLGFFDGDGTKGTHKIASASRGFLEDIKYYFDISNDIKEIKEGNYGLSLGSELFNEMMDTYSKSMLYKRRYFMTLQQKAERWTIYPSIKITDDFLIELQNLLFKAPEKVLADYYGIALYRLREIIRENNLNKPPSGYWVRRKFLGDYDEYF